MISERRFGEGPALTVYQKSEALNLTDNTRRSERWQVKPFGQESTA